MNTYEIMLEAKAAKLLVASLIKSLDLAYPGTIQHMDDYMLEFLSRPAVEADDRAAISVARELLRAMR